jgi:hypothetical protein
MDYYVIRHTVGGQVFYRSQKGMVWTTLLDNADVYSKEEVDTLMRRSWSGHIPPWEPCKVVE